MRLNHLIIGMLGILFLACAREKPSPDSPLSQDQCIVSLTVGKEPVTKSILPSGIENRLDNAFVLIMGANGYSRFKYFDFTSASQSSSVDWSIPAGQDYTVYAVGNMGDIYSSIPKAGGGFDMASFRYEVPAYSGLTALPMARVVSLSSERLAQGTCIQLPITLERLMARVSVRIDKSGITGGDAARALQSASLHLRQVAKALYPFRAEGSMALTDADVFSGDTDYYVFPASEAWNMDSGVITLYVPENRQGKLLGDNLVQARKSRTDAALAALVQKNRLTYVEYASSKNGSTDGVSGSLVYRGYLGGNETNDFSVERNRTYTASLNLSWDGFALHADGWRIDRGTDWNDSRRLAFLDAEGNALNYLKIHKKGTGEAFAYYSIDGDGGTGTAARKDVSSYPYGWYLTGNDVTLSGHDGSGDQYTVATGVTVQCLGAATVGGKAVTRLRFAASAAAEVTTSSVSDRHQFCLYTMDRARRSSDLQLDIEELPFEYEWVSDGMPSHVAQKGTLRCIDPYTGEVSTEGIFHIGSDCSTRIRLADNGDGTATVSVIGPFERQADALSITDAEGDRACRIALEGRVPHFVCSRPSDAPIYVDGSMDLKFSYLASDDHDSVVSSTVLKVSDDASVVKCGEYLDAALVEELIAPMAGSSGGILGFDRRLATDGTFIINTYLDTYAGLNPGTGESFPVDNARIAMKGYADAHAAHYRTPVSLPVSAYNPWRFMDLPVQGATMNDYTLYHEPKGWKAQSQVGWEASPAFKPEEKAAYSLDVGNVVVANLENLRFNAGFNDGGGYLGHKLFSGTPDKEKSWKLNYSMAGLQEGDIESHNAGKVLILLQLHNPHNASSPALERVVAEAYVRLHLYVWPAVKDVLNWQGSYVIPSTQQTVTDGWVFEAYPFAYTEGKSIHGLEDNGYENFFALSVLKARTELYTNLANVDLVSTSASQGTIARDINLRTGMAVWRFQDKNAFNSTSSEAQRRSQLMEALSGVQMRNPPFIFKANTGNDNLGSVLGSGTFYRHDDVTLYYDPSGSKRIYSTGSGDRDKLFVIHFGGGQELQSSYYFDSANGF